ncbi:MAG: hypothetical protein ABI947_12835 [Chloroflexota bacterium]
MTAQTRLTNAEKSLEALALGYVAKVYGIERAELSGLATLKGVVTGKKASFSLIELLRDLVESVADIEANRPTALDKVGALWIAAGLCAANSDRHALVYREVMWAFEVPAVATIETLLDLDRQIYERCRLTESEVINGSEGN